MGEVQFIPRDGDTPPKILLPPEGAVLRVGKRRFAHISVELVETDVVVTGVDTGATFSCKVLGTLSVSDFFETVHPELGPIGVRVVEVAEGTNPLQIRGECYVETE